MDGMDIKELGRLAGLDLTPAQMRRLAPQLAAITRFCGDLPAAGNVDDVTLAETVVPAPDAPGVERPLDRPVALANAPELAAERFITPSPLPDPDAP